MATPENGEKIRREWRPHWDLDRRYLLEKSPPNTLRAPHLETLFPESCFIYIVRHPLAVAFSMVETEWGRDAVPVLLRNWCAGHRYVLGDMPKLRRALLIRYEDLLEQPRVVMDKVSAFLGTTPIDVGSQVKQATNDRHFRTWQTFSRAHWLQAWQARRLEAELHRFGYSLRQPYVRAMARA